MKFFDRFLALGFLSCMMGLTLSAEPPSAPSQALSAYFEQQVDALEGQLEREVITQEEWLKKSEHFRRRVEENLTMAQRTEETEMKAFSARKAHLESKVTSKEDWLAKKDEYRRQLEEMLGLDLKAPRSDLKATKTGEFEHEGIIVEKLHFQSKPGLYVTANLYRPKVVEKPLPTILYVCGHSTMVKDGISYGNKAGYEHHGVWYAKHGFVCLVIDTVELGEIRGEHHGTYSKGRWWWMARGYTPAGVEAWAGIRALDYLETRPEVDKTKFGVAGRSGGGAYSWFIAALDERIACAVPTAGITTLRNHVVDGCVEGHCDCMFMVNTYRWDYDKLAALVAPRPLCITNTDKDSIFPVDGVFNIYQSTRRIYKLLDAEKNIGLHIAEGPHKDTQPLNTGEFHWMTRFLQGADLMSTLDAPAVKSIPMEKLRVFEELPKDEINTKIDESFVPKAVAKVPENAAQWQGMRDGWMKALREKCFAGWEVSGLGKRRYELTKRGTNGIKVSRLRDMSAGPRVNRFGTEPTISVFSHEMREAWESAQRVEFANAISLPHEDIWLIHHVDVKPQDLELIVLNVLDEKGWQELTNTYADKFKMFFPEASNTKFDEKAFESEKKMFENFKWGMAYVCPRGIGPSAWDGSAATLGRHQNENGSEAAKKADADNSVRAPVVDAKAVAAAEKARTHNLRRFYLLGQTLESQQVLDIRSAIRALRSIEGLKDTKLWLQGSRMQAGNVLYASLFEEGIARLDLHELPHSHEQGPIYLNVLKYLDIPQAAAMAAERTRVVIYDDNQAAWSYPKEVSEKLGWGADKKTGLQLRPVPKEDKP